jgi:hypothetical protein
VGTATSSAFAVCKTKTVPINEMMKRGICSEIRTQGYPITGSFSAA